MLALIPIVLYDNNTNELPKKITNDSDTAILHMDKYEQI